MSNNTDTWLTGTIVGAGALAGAVWAAAHTAAFLGGTSFTGGWGQAFLAIYRLANNPSDPTAAWQAGTLPGPVLYWTVTIIVVGTMLCSGVFGWVRFTRTKVRTKRTERLGLVPDAKMATKQQMAPLMIKDPVPGRLAIGRVMGKVVATEDPETQTRRQIRNRRKTRVGDRTSVMIFGPSRSGKTATVVPGVLEWDHPAIISSVKADVFEQTLQRRQQVGSVFLFDPFMVVPRTPHGVQRVSWSPISCAQNLSGALGAARNLADAAASDDLTSQGYWADRGAALLWPLLFTAAISDKGHSMDDVVRWLASQDGIEPGESEVLGLLTEAMRKGGGLGAQAQRAFTSFEGWTKMDPKQRSDQNSTAQSLVSCWADPFASAASDPDMFPSIDLPTILSGRNTLYVVQPLGMGDHFAPLFGGLFGDLVKDQSYRIAQAARRRIGPVLAMLDEAANTPLRWLPDVASTCAGIGVQLVTVWQDQAQIENLYKTQAQSLLNNHATKVFFAGQSDPKTLEYASGLCGEEEVVSTSASADLQIGSDRRGVSEAPTSKRLVPTDLLRQMPTGTALLIHNTLPPVHMEGRMLPEETKLLKRINRVEAQSNGDIMGSDGSLVLEPRLAARGGGDGPKIQALEVHKDVRAAFTHARPVLPDFILAHLAGTTQSNPDTGPNPPSEPKPSAVTRPRTTGSFGDLDL